MKHYVDACARCPFYLHEDRQVIYCEGITADTTTHVAFANCTDCKAYKADFCKKNWHRCRIAGMLAKKYEANG